ncbi:MAG TPA: heme o synthase [Candidatus Sulfotelmatobacter sp.]|nr:heme o synthase [Candidatus Sulfotelmatobacter sp.]
MIKNYYYLTKPGIIYGNALTTIAGFLLACGFHVDIKLFLATIFGSSFIIASACVINNYVDRDIDRVMERTKGRALVVGAIDIRKALVYSGVLLILGCLLLILFVNLLVLAIGLIAFFIYLVPYAYYKRHSVHGTIVGSLAGAAPILAGYCAVSGKLDLTATILFVIMLLWQMPHFYSIAIYRIKEYRAAGLPVLPVKKGIPETKRQILIYIGLFIAANIALSIFGPTGLIYAAVMSLVGLYWLRLGLRQTTDNKKWARKMFLTSLEVVLVLSVMLSIGSII